jgi:hypothetical protein
MSTCDFDTCDTCLSLLAGSGDLPPSLSCDGGSQRLDLESLALPGFTGIGLPTM